MPKEKLKDKRNILVGFRVTRDEYVELASVSSNSDRTIAGEIRNRVFKKEPQSK